MKSWMFLVPSARVGGALVLLVGLAGALTTSSGCAGEERNPSALATESIADVEQRADGCGALRYRGSANITCDYKGESRGLFDATGSCVNGNKVSCTYDLRCHFILHAVTTTCVEGSTEICWSQAPPEASDPVPQTVYVYDLQRGDTLCDPPSGGPPSQSALNSYCYSRRQTPIENAEASCAQATSRNTSGTTCCLDCPSPLPPTGGPPACYQPDGGVSADAGVDAPGSPSDARVSLDAGVVIED